MPLHLQQRIVLCNVFTPTRKALDQWFSKWAGLPGGDFERQGGENNTRGDRGQNNTKGAKMLNH